MKVQGCEQEHFVIQFNRQFDPRKMKLLIFDLDGTLIDSRWDLINAVNAMLRHFERPELPPEVITAYVGDGARMLVRRALGHTKDEHFLQEALEFFLAFYSVHNLDYTRTFEGVGEMLDAVQASQNGTDRNLTVLSNKPVEAARAIVKGLGIDRLFNSVYGGNSFATQKPDPLGARKVLEETNTDPELALVIGDSPNDVLTGRNAGMWSCGVTYGFAPCSLREAAPDVIVDTPRELQSLFSS